MNMHELLFLPIACATECINIGGGFCSGDTANDCCPFFNGANGSCVDSCAIIGPNFEPDADFTCGE